MVTKTAEAVVVVVRLGKRRQSFLGGNETNDDDVLRKNHINFESCPNWPATYYYLIQ
jgi:hypothetical protein